MPNDLEEFLRQAAAMRQQKAMEQRAEAERLAEQQSRSRTPAYSNARAERVVDVVMYDDEDEEPVMAVEVLDHTYSSSRSASSNSPSATMVNADSGHSPSQTSTASEIREMLRRPNGVRQAFLIREILNRPNF